MKGDVRLFAVAAAMLMAAYIGGWESLAEESRSAPTLLPRDTRDSAETPLGPRRVFLDSTTFRPIRLPESALKTHTVSLLATTLDSTPQPIAVPPSHWQLTSRGILPVQFNSVSSAIALSDPKIQFAFRADDDATNDWDLNLRPWLGEDGRPLNAESTFDGWAGTAEPWPVSLAAAEGPLLPPHWPDGTPPAGFHPDDSVANQTPIPVFTQEWTAAGMELPARPRFAARFGWWGVDQRGNPAKVGEFQSLNSSAFLDLDGLLTDGVRTLDFHTSILDNDASSTYGRYFSPSLSARWDYERYLRRLDHDPLRPFVDFDQQPTAPLPPAPENFRDMKEDLSVGDDFAIRVQQLDTRFQGKLTNNINWRLNIWGMRKHGERQALAMAHCYTAPNATDTNGDPVTGVACHIFSQRQRIDWLTAEIEPVLEGRFGPVTAEYSRTIRALTTDDQLVTRPYDNFGFNGDLSYNLVPENLTEIDRLKFGITLPERRNAYARFYNGNTENDFRDTNRRFHGMDLRVSDRSVDGIAVTAYAKTHVQTGQFPRFLLPLENVADIRQPINFDRTIAGVETSWRPFHGELSRRRHLRFNVGYEYRELDRENAVFVGNNLAVDQSSTRTNKIHLRAGMRWSPSWNSYLRYKVLLIDNPLFGIADNDTTNTAVPTQTHRVEFRNTWSPTHVFLLSGLVGLDYDWNTSEVANFQSDNYDFVFTAWYAPTPRWSVSGGLAFYRNWIDQDITLGPSSTPLTLPWEYGGRSDVVNVGTTFAWTKKMTLSATLDLVHGKNAFDRLARWVDLKYYSDVLVQTTRFMAGIDYELGPRANCYFRYQLFDYDDESEFFDSGTAEMLLFGGTAVF